MKRAVIRTAACLLVACALATTAQAAIKLFGVSVTRDQEAAVRIGMTTQEVLALLGPPATRAHYRIAPGPSWSYQVSGLLPNTYSFDVQFGADGRVIGASERYSPAGG